MSEWPKEDGSGPSGAVLRWFESSSTHLACTRSQVANGSGPRTRGVDPSQVRILAGALKPGQWIGVHAGLLPLTPSSALRVRLPVPACASVAESGFTHPTADRDNVGSNPTAGFGVVG